MRVLSLSLIAALSCSLASAEDDKAIKELQGDWQMVHAMKDGKRLGAEALVGKVWRFEGNKLIPLDNKNDVATITIDATKKPATLTLKDKGDKVMQAIYKIDNGRLSICAGSDGKSPKDFDAPQGSGNFLFEFERVKKK